MPSISAATCRETRSASAPNERTPITGLRGSVLTSATGPMTTSAPISRTRRASSAPVALVAATSSSAPSCAAPGTVDPVAASIRVTLPPSSSMPMSTAGLAARSSALSARIPGPMFWPK